VLAEGRGTHRPVTEKGEKGPIGEEKLAERSQFFEEKKEGRRRSALLHRFGGNSMLALGGGEKSDDAKSFGSDLSGEEGGGRGKV